ncbi:hypothetical protein LK996_11335 [Lysobacter sp. A6]|uniref:Uncharacterized protein n=1 Tax=Noviluteimonas lactosilytica TaxID=2888523 RepID=A0ABS8JJ90_9GAMM|nr:hypothetical protein [Lysobacter lactosilyticus]MCC8363662.1 hypothetical protein [Lysobacter lactosilyticus]
MAAVRVSKPKKAPAHASPARASAIVLPANVALAPRVRECGCPLGQRCDCAPRLRIFDPTGRFLLSPVYY